MSSIKNINFNIDFDVGHLWLNKLRKTRHDFSLKWRFCQTKESSYKIEHYKCLENSRHWGHSHLTIPRYSRLNFRIYLLGTAYHDLNKIFQLRIPLNALGDVCNRLHTLTQYEHRFVVLWNYNVPYQQHMIDIASAFKGYWLTGSGPEEHWKKVPWSSVFSIKSKSIPSVICTKYSVLLHSNLLHSVYGHCHCNKHENHDQFHFSILVYFISSNDFAWS